MVIMKSKKAEKITGFDKIEDLQFLVLGINIDINDNSGILLSPLYRIYLEKELDGRIFGNEANFQLRVLDKFEQFAVLSISPQISETKNTGLRFSKKTKLEIREILSEKSDDQNIENFLTAKPLPYFQFGNQVSRILRIIDYTFNKDICPLIGLSGVLLSGETGNGKSRILNKIAEIAKEKIPELDIRILKYREFMTATFLSEDFNHPAIILIDQAEELAKESLSRIEAFMRKDRKTPLLVIIAIRSSYLSSWKPICCFGCFEITITIDPLTQLERKQFINQNIKSILKNKDADVEELSHGLSLRTAGYSIGDLTGFIREIELELIDTNTKLSDNLCKELEAGISLHPETHELNVLEKSIQSVVKRGLHEFTAKVEKVKYSDIGGYEEVKQRIKTVIEMPLRNPEKFKQLGIKPSRGILLYGPPGCSKTLFAKAIATESGMNFISVKGPELFHKYVGSSEARVREIFQRARFCAPAVIFFDEIDALASSRGSKNGVGEKVLTQLLTEIDGVEEGSQQGIIIVAATNRPETLDSALIRPGRLDELIYIHLPDKEARVRILTITTSSMPISDEISVQSIAEQTERYSGAELVQLCREAAMQQIFEKEEKISTRKISKSDFGLALKRIVPRTIIGEEQKYEKFLQRSKR